MMINTIFGIQMDDSMLDRHIEVIDNENELTQCPEYRLKKPFIHEGEEYPAGYLVHRSVHVQLKKNVSSESIAAAF